MLLHRTTLVVISTLFTAGMTSIASAGCCDWGAPAPVAYASSGCGGCGAAVTYVQPVTPARIVYPEPAPAPIIYAEPVAPAPITVNTGCGGCGVSSAAAVFAQPVAPTPVVSTWGNGCGCNRGIFYAAPVAVAPAPYVVDQGPDYTGPGIMVPYKTYSRAAAYVPATNFPYVHGYGYGPRYGYHYGARSYRSHFVAYRARFYGHPHYYAPMGRMRPTWHRPLDVRG